MKYKNYVSNITTLINDMKKKDPNVEKRQMEGFLLLWNKKPLDFRDITDMESNKKFVVPQPGYVYHYTPIINRKTISKANSFK